MSASSPAPGATPPAPSSSGPKIELAGIGPVVAVLEELGEDTSMPRNVRRGALAAKAELEKPRVAEDVRIASAVDRLGELANDPNLPVHGRTALWSIISQLESLSGVPEGQT